MKNLLALLLFIPSFAMALTGLEKGADVPNLSLKLTNGKTFELSSKTKSAVLVFYRGSWCPYCVRQLKGIDREVASKLKGKTELIAISVDKLSVAKKMKDKFKLSYSVASDPKAKSLDAFKIVNQVSDELVAKYKSAYSIDIEGDSGEVHHKIAHPGVFIVRDGKIVFADVHKDYKSRTNNSEILSNFK